MISLIAPTHYFKLSNGQIIKHINELSEAIERMPDALFKQYVNNNKNDFSKWVYDVFRLTDLSSILGNIKSKQENARIIRAYLYQKNYSKPKVLMKNSQEVVHIKSKQEQNQRNNTAKKEIHHKTKYNWENKNFQKPLEQKVVTVKPENVETNQKDEAKKQVEKVIIKEKNIHLNLTKENITDADKYFDENPVLVSQMISVKKKNLMQESLEKISYLESENFDKIIELFKDTYTKAYEKLVFLRKNSFDTKLIQLMLFRIPSRIKLYEAAHEKKQAIQITRYLNEAIEELNNIHG